MLYGYYAINKLLRNINMRLLQFAVALEKIKDKHVQSQELVIFIYIDTKSHIYKVTMIFCSFAIFIIRWKYNAYAKILCIMVNYQKLWFKSCHCDKII